MAAVAEGAAGDVPDVEAEKGKSKLPLIIGVVVLLAGGGAGAYFGGFLTEEPVIEEETPIEDMSGKVATSYQPGAIVKIDPFIANLADDDANRYLKVTFSVEFVGTEPHEEFERRTPQMRDSILTLFTSKRFGEVRTPVGKQQLREDVIDRINQALEAEAVRAVYFTEFIVQ